MPDDACEDGTVEQIYVGGAMVGCDGVATQCDAAALCGDGWHHCPFEEYLEQGGADQVATAPRWIRSCIREVAGDATMTCPSSGRCAGTCEGSSGGFPREPKAFTCDNPQPSEMSEDAGPLGVVSSVAGPRVRVGCPDVGCSYASSYLFAETFGATCCSDSL